MSTTSERTYVRWYMPHSHAATEGSHVHDVLASHALSVPHGDVPSCAVAEAVQALADRVTYVAPLSPALPGSPLGDEHGPGAVLRGLVEEVRVHCQAQGWYDVPVSLTEAMMLLTTEAAEVVGAWRKRGFDAWVTEKGPQGVASEMADIFIRLLDDCGRFGVDLFAEYERKMAYNRTRPYRHGDRPVPGAKDHRADHG